MMRQAVWVLGCLLFVILQQMCEHSRKPKIFCISEQCGESLWFGCSECMKKCHRESRDLVLQEELLRLMKVYQVPNQVKEQRKSTIYKVYQTLNNIKNQIYDHIDSYFNSILSKIKYPFLYRQNILEPYRLVRDKNYHKMDHSQLIAFCKTSKATTNQEFISKEIKYYQEYLKQTQTSLQLLTSQMATIEKIFSFGISKESHSLHKQLLAELSSFGAKQSALEIKQLQIAKQITKSWTSLKGSDHQSKQEKVQPLQKDPTNSLNNSLRLELPRKKAQSFLTPTKQERDLDLSFDKTASILLQEQSEVKPTHLSQTQNILLGDERESFKGIKNKSSVQQRRGSKKDKQEIVPKVDEKKESRKDERDKPVAEILREYSNIQSNTDSIFIKISEVNNGEKDAEKSDSKLTKSTISQEKGDTKLAQSKSALKQEKQRQLERAKQKKEAVVKQKQENVKKRLAEFIKSKDQEKKLQPIPLSNNKSIPQPNQKVALKTQLEVKPSYFLNVTAKRKGSRHQSQFNDSLGKDVFEFAREQKPKIISRSIKKEIPYIDQGNSVKTEPVPKNNSFLIESEQGKKEKQVEMAAIFMSGINQPLSENKICFLQKYLQRYENNLTAVEYLTYLYLEKGKFKECLNLTNKYLDRLKQCLADNETRMTLTINKSGALNNLGRYSQTIKLLEEELRVGDKDKMHKNIADAYYNINVLDKAIYHYERAIKSNSQFDEAYFNVAVILYRQESYFNAKMNIEKALTINKTEENYLELHSHIEERISMNGTRM